jgi:hypothetical protein
MNRNLREMSRVSPQRHVWPKDFREEFCQHEKCPPVAFERRVFWRCLHRRSLPLAALVYTLYPAFFEPDLRAIQQLAVTRSFEEFAREVDSLRSDNQRHGGFLRRKLRLRISGRRLMRLVFGGRHREVQAA